jgi:putative hydrolase of the HAD superfamily
VSRFALRAVTFDYWNTIVRADADQASYRRAAWRLEYATAGHVVDDEALREAFGSVWARHQAAWIRNEQFTGQQAAQAAVDLLGRPVDAATRLRLVERFVTVGEEAGFGLCEGVAEVLTDLHDLGVQLGIVCDVGFTPASGLRRILERFGLLGCFAGSSFSDEVGWYKPAPEIFEHALGYLGARAHEAAHVGDLRRTDVAGARAVGMTSVRYRGANDDVEDGPEADHVIDHHAELRTALAL